MKNGWNCPNRRRMLPDDLSFAGDMIFPLGFN